MVNHYHVLYFYVFISSVAILAFLYNGQTYSRRSIPDFDHGNITDPAPFLNDTRDQWPFEMNLGMINYVCTIPASNFNVTENQLIASWHLPPKTRLSPIMREMARCRLAANQLASKSVQFDINQCYCVDSWPVELFFIGIFGIAFWIYAIVFDFPAVPLRSTVRIHLKAILITYIPLLVWRMADIMIFNYFYGDHDIGLWYSIYGDIFSTNYYQKSASFIFIRFAIVTNYWSCIFANLAAYMEFGFFILYKLIDWLYPDPQIITKDRKIPQIKIDAAIGKIKMPEIDAAITKNMNQITTVNMNVEYLKSTHV